MPKTVPVEVMTGAPFMPRLMSRFTGYLEPTMELRRVPLGIASDEAPGKPGAQRVSDRGGTSPHACFRGFPRRPLDRARSSAVKSRLLKRAFLIESDTKAGKIFVA